MLYWSPPIAVPNAPAAAPPLLAIAPLPLTVDCDPVAGNLASITPVPPWVGSLVALADVAIHVAADRGAAFARRYAALRRNSAGARDHVRVPGPGLLQNLEQIVRPPDDFFVLVRPGLGQGVRQRLFPDLGLFFVLGQCQRRAGLAGEAVLDQLLERLIAVLD